MSLLHKVLCFIIIQPKLSTWQGSDCPQSCNLFMSRPIYFGLLNLTTLYLFLYFQRNRKNKNKKTDRKEKSMIYRQMWRRLNIILFIIQGLWEESIQSFILRFWWNNCFNHYVTTCLSITFHFSCGNLNLIRRIKIYDKRKKSLARAYTSKKDLTITIAECRSIVCYQETRIKSKSLMRIEDFNCLEDLTLVKYIWALFGLARDIFLWRSRHNIYKHF